MRPYRARRIDNNERVYGSLIVHNAYDLNNGIHKPEPLRTFIRECDVKWRNEPNDKCWTHFQYEVHPETVAQSTGKHDKNGDEIFKGMTVHYEWHDPEYQEGEEYTGTVYFEDGAFWLQMTLNSYDSKDLVIIP